MFCRNCGKQMADGAKFCENCGTPVAAPAEPWAAGPAPEAVPAEVDEPVTKVIGEESPAEAPAPEEETAEAAPAEAEQPVEEAPAESPAGTVEEDAPAAPEADAPAAPVNIPRFDIPYTEPQAEGGAAPAKQKNKTLFAVIGVAAAALIALAAVGIWMVTSLMGGGGKTLCVYLNDDGELMYLSSLKEGAKAVEITDEADYGANVQFSRDGKTVYFLDENSTLYQIAAADLEKDGGKPDRIARNVSGYQVLDKGRVLFFENVGGEYSYGNYKVSLYEDGQSSRLVKSCGTWSVSEDEKTLYYVEQDDEDGTYTLYKMALSGDGKEEELLDGYDSLYTSYDAGTLVYSIRSEGQVDQETGRTSGSTLTIYSCKPGEKGTQLVSGAYSVNGVTVDGGKVSFYYTVENKEERTLYDFVTDEKAEEDAAMLNGEVPMPAIPDSFYSYTVSDIDLAPDGLVYYYDHRGESYLLDMSGIPELEGYAFGTGDWMGVLMMLYETGELHQRAGEEALARYEADSEAYNEWWMAEYAAEAREQLREWLKGIDYGESTYSLHRYDDGKKTDAAEGLQSRNVYTAGGVAVYRKAEDAGVQKVIDLAELGYDEYYEDYYYNAYGNIDDYTYICESELYDLLGSDEDGTEVYWAVSVGGKESPLDIGEDDYVYGLYKVSDKELVLHLYDGYEDRLDSFAIGADQLTLSDTICEGDFSVAGISEESGNKSALYLFTDTETDSNYRTLGDFRVYRNGRLETIAKEVYGAVILDKSGATYVVTDWDSEYNAELAVLKDGKPVTISDEVSGGGFFLDGGQVLYLSDGDLYLWDGKESRRIARDVEHLWVSHEETYQDYNP